jgi:hypothetical protein
MNNTTMNGSLVADIMQDVQSTASIKTSNIFKVKSANEWVQEARLRPIPKPLFKELWYEGEMCILFADSNVGKSILAYQIANDLGEVLYLDFELSDKQFEARYSNDYQNHYRFPEGFIRAEIDPDAEYESSFEEYLIKSLERLIIETGIKIVIVDNITYLRNEVDKAKNALPLMKELKALKSKYGLSLLILAHTPKRDLSKPLTQNDLGGSKMIMNFCDSAFAIGASQQGEGIRYIKQIKERNTPKIYGADNVLVYRISKPDNYLFMVFIAFGCEREHLKLKTDKDRENDKIRVRELNMKGLSQREIAEEIGIGVSTVNKYIHA